MRLLLILPRVEPEEIKPPSECPYEDCDGRQFQFLQEVEKPLRDTKYSQVVAHRYQCLRCFRTYRVYPKGVSSNRPRTSSVQGPITDQSLPHPFL